MASLLATLGSTMGASFMPEQYCGRGQLPSPRLLFGTALSFAGLSVIADFAPKIAAGLAASMAVTALGYYGIPVLDAVFTDTPCTPRPNGRNTNNTSQPAAPVSAGVIPNLAFPQFNPGTGNRAATPTF